MHTRGHTAHEGPGGSSLRTTSLSQSRRRPLSERLGRGAGAPHHRHPRVAGQWRARCPGLGCADYALVYAAGHPSRRPGPRDPSNRVIGDEQRLTIQEALRAHTLGAAYAAHEEKVKGSLEVGKLADVVV
ncbi:MAG: amidohydrolase family protein [Chloroflexi bacterium]|nr:amidohydrolase family protein [Chloroflexota bacterium]